MKEVILLVGPSGIGKTTWAANHLPDYEVCSLDADADRHMDKYRLALEVGAPKVVVDNTCRDRNVRAEYIRLARIHGYRLKAVVFDFSDIRTVMARGAARDRLPPQEQVAAVTFFLSVYQPVTLDEVDEIETVPLT